jgi:hypothetical protein
VVWQGFVHVLFFKKIMTAVSIIVHEFGLLSGGIGLMLVVVIAEWNTILNYLRVDRMPIAEIEFRHPRLPSRFEIAFTAILTGALLTLFFQFVMTVYAMSFTLYATSTEVNPTHQIIVSDFNNDGFPDYVARNTGEAPSYPHDLYINNGFYGFWHADFGSSPDRGRFAAGDINGDGYPDLTFYDGGLFRIYKLTKLTTSGSTFTEESIVSLGSIGVTGNMLADVNNDGFLDVVISTDNIEEAVYLNNGHGGFTAAHSTIPVGAEMAMADFNSDGYLDILSTYVPAPGAAGGVSTFINSGTGAFVSDGTVCMINASDTFYNITTGDVNGDGYIDAVIPSITKFYVMIGDGAGSCDAVYGPYGNSANMMSVALGDVDNDGDLDVVTAAIDAADLNGGNETWLNDGTGHFTLGGTAAEVADGTASVAFGDFDDDGDLDYIAGNYAAGLAGEANRTYKNDQAATLPNTAPTAATSLSATNGNAAVLSQPGAGFTYVAIASDNAGTGSVAWSQVDFASMADLQYASANGGVGDKTHYVQISQYGLSIPSQATIHGIKVSIKHSAANAHDNAVRIVKGGVIGTTDKANPATWADEWVDYGGATDLWGETWTPSDINNSNFGMVISAQIDGITGPAIDGIYFTVYYSFADVRLSWGSGSDAETATRMLQYQLRVGTGSNTNNIVSGVTASPNYVTRQMPNGQSKTMLLKNLTCGLTYYWNVATVDTGYKATWGTEKAFSISNDCSSVTEEAAATPVEEDTGGGWGLSVLRQETVEVPTEGTLLVTVFSDANGNRKREAKELTGFPGLPVNVVGTNANGEIVERHGTVGESGTVQLMLPPSAGTGYTVSVDTGSSVVAEYRPTVKTLTGVTVFAGKTERVDFGFVRKAVMGFRSCLTIGEAGESTGEEGTGEAADLLSRLEDSFGKRVMEDLDFSEPLVSRRAFILGLARTQCALIEQDPAKILQKLGAEPQNTDALTLKDLPLEPPTHEALTVYSLLAQGLPVSRETTIGKVADLQSPVSRREVLMLTAKILNLQDGTASGSEVLPEDLAADDPAIGAYRALKQVDLLPRSFQRSASLDGGIDPTEVLSLLARAALRAGKIGMVEPTFETEIVEPAAQPTFLSVLPSIPLPSCLEEDKERADTFNFTDVRPGDDLFSDVRLVLQYGVKSAEGEMLWLLPGTRILGEAGVKKGQGMLLASELPSVLETLRALLLLTCRPPETRSTVTKSLLMDKNDFGAGSAEQRVSRDRISDMKRTASYASRVLYQSQDHERAFDLSLLKFAEGFLREEPRDPLSALTVGEASDVLASAVLGIAVKSMVLTPQDAETKAQEVSEAIKAMFLHRTSVTWREEGLAEQTPFTRAMLVEFLATVITGRTDMNESPTVVPPVGELWWERVR